jgi:glutaredoxin 2
MFLLQKYFAKLTTEVVGQHRTPVLFQQSGEAMHISDIMAVVHQLNSLKWLSVFQLFVWDNQV